MKGRALVAALACALLAAGCGATSGLQVENSGHTLKVTAAAAAQPRVKSLDAVAFVDAAHGWAAGTNAIIATSDGGNTWTQQFGGRADIRSLEFTDTRHGWAVASTSLLRTSDGGATWSAGGEPSGLVLTGVEFVSTSRGWGIALRRRDVGGPVPGALVSTADGGITWSVVKRDVGDSLCVAGGTLVAGAGSSVLRSTDGGTAWTQLLEATDPRAAWMAATVECAGSSIWALFTGGFAAGSEAYAAYASVDAGASWRPVVAAPLLDSDPTLRGVTQLDAYAGPFAAASATEAVFLGQCPACDPQHVMVLRTHDGGARWTRHVVNGFSPTGLAFADPTHGWMTTQLAGYPSRHPAILATTDGGRSWHPVYPA